jgi:ubiquinone/menaquinone biosynthesis C-methylase UbiE
VHGKNRSGLSYKIAYAIRSPDRITGYARRRGRDILLWLATRDHVSCFRAVMRADANRGSDVAVGSRSRESWLRIGQLRFDYLLRHGLTPGMRMLDIGCGNLQAGLLFIDYLDTGNYYGTDISPDILLSAEHTITEFGLQRKLPHLALIDDLRLEFLPDECFDVVRAHSVFSHSPLNVIEECLAHVGRVMAPAAFFDFTFFTFDRTEGAEHQVLREDFYYQTETLISLARQQGLDARFMSDWAETGHQQSRIRVIRPA